jgi:methylenetetrahydrofolate reductase (NADPH)
MLRTTALTPMAHLTCAAHSRLDLAEILVRYRRAGVENVLALGGDPPTGAVETVSELNYASELVELARSIGGFSIGVAAHPELHPRSPDRDSDRRLLAEKLKLADFAITQFFFQPEHYLRMVDELAALGVDKPIIPGIMPVTNVASVERMAQMSGASFPVELLEPLHAAATPDDARRIGIDWATEMCRVLLDHGVPGLHFYTLNLSSATRQIYANLGLAPVNAA